MDDMLWTPTEIAQIMNDAREIDNDPTLRVNSDGTHTRPLGYWEEMRLDQAAMIHRGDVHVTPERSYLY